MTVTVALLSSFPLLKMLGDERLEKLAPLCQLQRYARRQLVLEAGTLPDRVCFVFEGRLQGVDFTLDGREVGLYFVGPGESCGELALFDEGVQPEHMIVLAPATILEIPLPVMRELMLSDARLSHGLGQRLAGRLRAMSRQRALLSMANISQRVCAQLIQMVAIAQDRKDGGEIRSPPTHQELAIMLNLSRETVTRVFQRLQSSGVVQRDGAARLVVINLKALKKLAAGENEASPEGDGDRDV
jgi:CRP/FNR family cyclic AMP-dependent transcriptional regulator